MHLELLLLPFNARAHTPISLTGSAGAVRRRPQCAEPFQADLLALPRPPAATLRPARPAQTRDCSRADGVRGLAVGASGFASFAFHERRECPTPPPRAGPWKCSIAKFLSSLKFPRPSPRIAPEVCINIRPNPRMRVSSSTAVHEIRGPSEYWIIRPRRMVTTECAGRTAPTDACTTVLTVTH